MKSRIKKHLILLASALIAIPAILAPVRASAANNGYGSMVAPNVTPDMETAAYWIAKNPNANDLLMTPQQIEQLNKDIAYAKATPVQIRLECDEGMGSISSESHLTKKPTDIFTVEARISPEAAFIAWKAYSEDLKELKEAVKK